MTSNNKRQRINYNDFTFTCVNKPSEKILYNFYSKIIDNLIEQHGANLVKIILEQLNNEESE